MRKLTISLVAMALLFAGCQKPELECPQETKVEFSSQVESFGYQTKTALNSEEQMVWSEGDCLSIFQGGSIADQYELKENCTGSTTGSFRWVFRDNSLNSDFDASMEIPCNVAFYPYAEGVFLEKNVQNGVIKSYSITNVVLPQVQTYAANSLANGSFPMVAVTKSMEDHNLKFRNVLGAIKLSLKGTQTVKSIKIEGLNGEKLSGAATVTAYPNNLNPVFMFSTGASSTVTLDCGEGVKLNNSKATDFYVALPPVLFEKGFKVSVKDVADQEFARVSKVNSVVLRSSILVMPAFTLGAEGGENPGNDDELVVPVTSLSLNSTSLNLYDGDTFQLTATIRPKDATDQVVWSSDDSAVATVDQTGLVAAVSLGSTTINVVAGSFSAKCNITVKTLNWTDYVDEYGVNHGRGTPIGMTIWAPVNCGYHEADYKWGKLYQWGRKYGQGYDGDATTPKLSEGGVSLNGGNHKSNANVFYYGSLDWLDTPVEDVWNSGSESSPIKTQYDPCPDGWRVPTYNELKELCKNYSNWTTNEKGQSGYWFSGASSYTEDVPQVFFPTAGYSNYNDGSAKYRGSKGLYWSSKPYGYGSAYYLDFSNDNAGMCKGTRADGDAVRCVQELTSVSIPVSSISLNKTSLKLYESTQGQLTATVGPSDASDKTVTWSSENPAVATVDQAGRVTAVAEGTTTIYAVAGRKQASSSVTVVIPSIELNTTSLKLDKGYTRYLTATVSPSDVFDKTVTWSSENSAVATVNQSGRVTAVAEGTTTIYAIVGRKQVSCSVSVIIPVSSIALNMTSLKLYKGTKGQLTATVSPSDATDRTVTWSSGDPAIASVDETGLVTAVSEGSTIIYAQSDRRGASCAVTVRPTEEYGYYVDDDGINHGKGIAIGKVVWAPVNCGYHAEDYKWGKLYQWGRKYGQGFDGYLYDVDGQYVGKSTDAGTPILVEGPVSLAEGNSVYSANVFYTDEDYSDEDWLSSHDRDLWDSGTYSSPIKTHYDPCPLGWRVPTFDELKELRKNSSNWTTNEAGQPGYWFSGATSYEASVPQVFLPAAGHLGFTNGYGYPRGLSGYYWSSSTHTYQEYAYCIGFENGDAYKDYYSRRAEGHSVRCVQE